MVSVLCLFRVPSCFGYSHTCIGSVLCLLFSLFAVNEGTFRNDKSIQLGYNPNDYGLHSLRSGGATSAVYYSGHSIPERLLKIHGRWKSDSAKDMYVHESLENRLQVTKYLGL